MDKMFAFIDSANDWLWSYVVKVLLVNLVAFFLLYPKVSALLKILPSRPLGTRLTTLRPGRNKKVQARL